jgi:hypothetical protein
MMIRSLLFLSGLAGIATCSRAQVTPEWTWIPGLQLTCRDGSTTGIGLRHQDKSPSATANPGLMIYLEGGGFCVDALSCAGNAASWSQTDFDGWKRENGDQGISAFRQVFSRQILSLRGFMYLFHTVVVIFTVE